VIKRVGETFLNCVGQLLLERLILKFEPQEKSQSKEKEGQYAEDEESPFENSLPWELSHSPTPKSMWT
jgi:hypothetical protein